MLFDSASPDGVERPASSNQDFGPIAAQPHHIPKVIAYEFMKGAAITDDYFWFEQSVGRAANGDKSDLKLLNDLSSPPVPRANDAVNVVNWKRSAFPLL